jgi:hypothetical protein
MPQRAEVTAAGLFNRKPRSDKVRMSVSPLTSSKARGQEAGRAIVRRVGCAYTKVLTGSERPPAYSHLLWLYHLLGRSGVVCSCQQSRIKSPLRICAKNSDHYPGCRAIPRSFNAIT